MKGNDRKKVSVIVPIYNVQQYLPKCIESLKKQTYDNLQIILVNDGSTDDSGIVAKNLVSGNKQFELYNKTNGGLSDARNFGIEKATGELITFIDSDDYIEQDYVEYLVNLLDDSNADISICAYYVDRGKNSISTGRNYNNEILSPDCAIARMLNEEGFSVSAWGKLYKKDIFQDIRYPVGKICEDNGTTYKLLMGANRISYGSDAKYHYVQRNNSIMNSFNWNKMDLINLTDEMADTVLPVYPQIRDSVVRRQIYVRLSVLRQALTSKNANYADERILKMRKYVLDKKDVIKTNSNIDKRDRLGFYCLKIGVGFYAFSWKIYEKIRNMNIDR